jgi:hypothetical protein
MAEKTTLCSTRRLDRPRSILIVTTFPLDRYGNQRASETKTRPLPYSAVDEAFFAVTLCPTTRYILAQNFAVSDPFGPIGARFRHRRDTSVPIHPCGASAPAPTWPRPGGRLGASPRCLALTRQDVHPSTLGDHRLERRRHQLRECALQPDLDHGEDDEEQQAEKACLERS